MYIALVESSRAVRSLMVQLLESGGHRLRSFSDPREALDTIARDESLEGVITAAELSPISGIELCWEARLIAGGRRPLYIMLMTSHSDERTMLEGLDMGADEIISKPPSKKELLARLRVGERTIYLQAELIRLATTDPLTGLFNRRAFFEHGIELCRQCTDASRLSAILFDFDHFKEINDFYGHQTGDRALLAITTEAQKNQRIVGRLGGDEFCILVRDYGLSRAWEVAEELRCRVADLRIKTPDGSVAVTCSFGVSELTPGGGIDKLIRDADFALYRAKREGKNCVSTPPPEGWLEENPRYVCRIARMQPR